ncbi:MAG: selenide, water dikinase SelD [Anaerolineaceae bacterium 4572_78]|nr:MAG: selenide, water dikinase SelD [Anaerolineaceae bacterium 4572_78]
MQVLRPLRMILADKKNPNLLVGLNVADDAAIYRLNDEVAIISTTDFFTPIVDDPYDYGAVAAANSMGDVYAMGGEVLFALNIACFHPKIGTDVISEILRGGLEKVIEAGGIIAGGHTIQDEEPKYGLAVTGIVHPKKYFTVGGATVGDVLVLTKPLGTGVISTALKQGVAHERHVTDMIESMKELNRRPAQAAQSTGDIKSVTDVTGFGLLGHAIEMATAGQVKFQFQFDTIPLLDGVLQYAEAFTFPGGAWNNKLHFEKDVSFAESISEAKQMILWDPQTSGGLLLAIPAHKLDDFHKECSNHNQPMWVIGDVHAGQGIIIC